MRLMLIVCVRICYWNAADVLQINGYLPYPTVQKHANNVNIRRGKHVDTQRPTVGVSSVTKLFDDGWHGAPDHHTT